MVSPVAVKVVAVGVGTFIFGASVQGGRKIKEYVQEKRKKNEALLKKNQEKFDEVQELTKNALKNIDELAKQYHEKIEDEQYIKKVLQKLVKDVKDILENANNNDEQSNVKQE